MLPEWMKQHACTATESAKKAMGVGFAAAAVFFGTVGALLMSVGAMTAAAGTVLSAIFSLCVSATAIGGFLQLTDNHP